MWWLKCKCDGFRKLIRGVSMMKSMTRKRFGVCVIAMLLLGAAGCRNHIAVDSSYSEAPASSKTTVITPSATTLSATNTTVIADAPSATHRPVATTIVTQVPQKVNALRKDWETLSKEEQKLLNDSGLKEEDLVVDMSKLTYDKEHSSDIHPQYAQYTYGDKQYIFNDLKGKLTFVSLSKNHSEAQIDEATIERIARTVADLIVDVNKYTCERIYDDVTEIYTFLYTRMVDGYETLEGPAISIFYDGTISSIAIPKIGLFDGVKAPKVDEKWLDEECEKVLKKRYDNYASHTLKKMKLDIKDGQLLAYYQKQPEIKYGQMVLICECVPTFTNGITGRLEYVLVPIE